MTCEQCRELFELYALGALDNEETHAMKEHLAGGCAACNADFKRALDLNVLVARSAPMVDPPASLRVRVAQSVAPVPVARRQWLTWALATAALLALAIGLSLGLRLRRTDAGTAQTEAADQTRLSSALEILGAPGTRAISFTDAKSPELHGAVYIHQKLGLALIIDRLPTAPAGWKYESWVVPKGGAPHPNEPFHPDSVGRAVSVVPGPVEVAGLQGIAVSMEPLDSKPTKPTTLVFEARL